MTLLKALRQHFDLDGDMIKKKSLSDAKIQRAAGIKAGGDEGTDDDFVQVGDEEGCCEISHSDEVRSRLIYWSI